MLRPLSLLASRSFLPLESYRRAAKAFPSGLNMHRSLWMYRICWPYPRLWHPKGWEHGLLHRAERQHCSSCNGINGLRPDCRSKPACISLCFKAVAPAPDSAKSPILQKIDTE